MKSEKSSCSSDEEIEEFLSDEDENQVKKHKGILKAI